MLGAGTKELIPSWRHFHWLLKRFRMSRWTWLGRGLTFLDSKGLRGGSVLKHGYASLDPWRITIWLRHIGRAISLPCPVVRRGSGWLPWKRWQPLSPWWRRLPGPPPRL